MNNKNIQPKEQSICICILNNNRFDKAVVAKGMGVVIIDEKINDEQLNKIKQYDNIIVVDEARTNYQDFIHFLNKTPETKKREIQYLKTTKDTLLKRNFESLMSKIDKEIYYCPLIIAQTNNIVHFIGRSTAENNILHNILYHAHIHFFKFVSININAANTTQNISTRSFFKETWKTKVENSIKSPVHYLFSGSFFKEFFLKNNIKKDALYRLIMPIISIAMLVLMLSVVKDFGVSGDEPIGHRHSENVIKYYTENSSAAWDNTVTNMKYYGFSANVIAEIISHVTQWDIWDVRHYTNMVIGFIGLLFAGLVGLRIGGGAGGLLALIFMFLTPRYFGNSMNNLSDIPFATGYIIATYYIIRFFDFWPKVKLRYILGVILGIAFTISNRAPGILLYGYFLLYAGLYYAFIISGKDFYKLGIYKKQIIQFITYFIIILASSYFLSLALWPYGLERPFYAVYDSIVTFSKFPWSLTTIFDGVQKMSSKLPISYAPKYLLIGIPLFIHVGFIAFIASWFKSYRPNPISILLIFGCLFPIVYIIYKNSNIYGGMRHLTFVVTFFIVVASQGWVYLFKVFKKYYKIIPLTLISILLFLPVRHMVANHPNEYVYFNEIIGGMKGAYANYDMDYYYNSIKKGSEWLKKNIDLKEDTITVITNGSYRGYFDEYPNVNLEYCRYYEKSKEDWDYGIYSNVFIKRTQLLSDHFPPPGTIHTIDVDGYPVAFIFERESKEDLYGYNALQKRQYNEAIKHFNDYLKINPYNEEVIGYKAQIHLMKKDYARASALADSALALNPNYFNAIFIKITACNGLKKYDEALKWSEQIIEIKQDHAETYYQRGFALYHMGKANDALKELQKAVNVKDDYYTAFMLMGEIFINYKKYDQAIKVIYPKVLSFRKNDVSAQARMALCYYLKNDEKNANKILSEIPRKSMNRLDVVKLLTRMDLDKNNMAAAQRKINSMRRINNNSELEVLRAMFSIKLNDLKSANDYLDKAIELDKYNNEARELKNRIKPKTPSKNDSTVKAEDKESDQPAQQSVMFQEPKKKKRSVF